MQPPVSIDRLLEDQCRTIRLKHTLMDFSYLLDQRYRTFNPNEIIAPFKLRQKALQAVVM